LIDWSPSTVLFDTTQLALQGVISGAARRHEALAANLANANTPGYQRVDVDFHSQLAAALGSDQAPQALERVTFTPEADTSAGPVQADGNTVDAESESAKLAANALEQEAAVQVAAARITIMRSAMGLGA
jgi:flagellar basal-body rod protein FlgB